MSRLRCHMSRLWCHMSCVACHLSLMQAATATDPPPVNSLTMNSMLVHKNQQIQKLFRYSKIIKSEEKNTKISKGMPILTKSIRLQPFGCNCQLCAMEQTNGRPNY